MGSGWELLSEGPSSPLWATREGEGSVLTARPMVAKQAGECLWRRHTAGHHLTPALLLVVLLLMLLSNFLPLSFSPTTNTVFLMKM